MRAVLSSTSAWQTKLLWTAIALLGAVSFGIVALNRGEAVNAACVALGKPLVSGAAIRLEGQLSVFDPRRPESPCYHCLYGHGSEAELTCSEAGVIGPLVGLVGSLQALEALKLLVGFGEPLVGRLLLIDALGTRFRELRVKRDPGCSVCGGSHE